MTTPRVFQGVRGQAGQPKAFAQALMSHGIFSESYCNSINNFSYKHDHEVDFSKLHDPKYFKNLFTDLNKNFDVFHFHANSFFSTKHAEYPCFQDLYLLRDLGKLIIFHFRGSEVRIESECRQKNPYHFYDAPDADVAQIRYDRPDETQRRVISLIRGVAHRIYANDPEIQSYIPEAIIVPRAFQSVADRISTSQNPRPLVCHAPSRRAIKGTDQVLKAVEQLKNKGIDFDFKLVENMSHEDAIRLYEKSDIIIDQLRIGWYGVLSVEAMALGKPVLCYIREDLKHHLSNPPPLMMTTIDTLERDLDFLICNPENRAEIGSRGLQHFKETHDIRVVGEFLKGDLQNLTQTYPLTPIENSESIIERYCESILNGKKQSNRTSLSTILRLKDLTLEQRLLLTSRNLRKRIDAAIKYRKKNGNTKTFKKILSRLGSGK